MKARIISFILILCFILSSITVFSEDANKALPIQEEAVKTLKALDVLSDSALGGLPLSTPISRIDFIDLYISIMYPDYKSTATESPFKDVETTANGYDAVCLAYSMGLISGDGSGYFSPSVYISYNEALKLVVSLMGYKEMADIKGGYPYGYIVMGKQLGINHGVLNENVMTWGNCAVMLLNALETPMNKVYSVEIAGGYETAYYKEGDTFFYNALKIRKGRGVLKANQYTTLSNVGDAELKTVVISDFKGRMFGGVQHEVYLGYEVDYYYKVEDYGNCVLYVVPTDKNDVIKIESEDISGFNPSSRILSYYRKNRRYTVTIPGSAMVVLNGEAKPKYTAADFDNDDAEYMIIDNNGDGKVDVVSITAWNTIYVYTIDKENEKIIDKYDNAASLSVKDSVGWILWNDKFEEIELKDINVGSVLTYVKSESGEYIRGIISNQTVSGQVDTISKTSDGGYVLTIDQKEYRVAQSYANKFSVKVGQTITAVLSYSGRIAAIETDQSTSDYGYLIAAGSEDPFGMEIKVKMLKGNGLVSIVKLAKNAIIDGVSVKSMTEEQIVNALNTPQIMHYSLNVAGELIKVDTVGTTDGENNLLYEVHPLERLTYFAGAEGIFVGTGYGNAYDTNKVWYGELIIDSTTTIIVAPDNVSDAKDEDFGVYNMSYFTEDETHTVQAVSTNKNSFIPEAIFIRNDGLSSKLATPSLITDIYQALNEEDEIVTRIKVIHEDGGKGSHDIPDAGTVLENMDLRRGDFILFSTNAKGQITKVDRLYSQALKAYDPNSVSTGDIYYGWDFVPKQGKVYDRVGNRIAFTTKSDLESVSIADLQYFIAGNQSRVYLVDISSKGPVVKDATVDDIYDYKHYGDGSSIFFAVKNAVTRMVVIYR